MPQTRTRRQKEVLDFITRYIERNGYEPSYQVIARHLGVRSKAGIAKHIEALEEQGFLQRRGGDGGFKLQIIRNENSASPGFEVEWLRSFLDGRELEEWETAPLSVPQFMLGDIEPSEISAYRMPDDAMDGKNICSGDIILIQRRDYFRDGTCVAVTINKKQTLLRNHHRDGASVELRSANDDFPAIRVSADDIEVHGIYRGLLRPIT